MKIVVVEDEKSIRNGLYHMLPKLSPDYQVVGTASNGVEGMELISRMRPDLVIMDIQMPEMDGLTMLERLRKQGVQCKVVVLTAYSDFTYAKRAIELNIENYLLKPIKIPELQRTLEMVAKMIDEERGTEYLKEWALSLEQIFRGSILAEFTIDEELNRMTQEKYALNVKEPLAMLAIWLGEDYDHNAATVERIMEDNTGRVKDYRCCILKFSRYQMVGVIFYQIKDRDVIRKRYEDMVNLVLERSLKCKTVCFWTECEGLSQIADAFNELLENRMWSLSFPDGTLISPQLIRESVLTPVKYPLDMEQQIRQAFMNADRKSLEDVVRYFIRTMRSGIHHPDEIKESVIRFCLSVMTIGRTVGRVKESLSAQSMVTQVTQAFTWEELEIVMTSLYYLVKMERKEDEEFSPLVQRAKMIIEEYYMHGITLEELAEKLHVSEEYLSSQFKKETGVSFRDTVKKYRVDKIKELLLHSSLKLNQIADMVGYSDPKYMSKVFKEEVGVLPAEFRKSGQ